MKNYLSLIKFSHTIFAMPFAFIGFFLARKSYPVEWTTLFLIIFCMIFARSAAMAFNRYIDRKIDYKNPRTVKIREIPNGTISPNSALIFVIINSILFITTTLFINTLCFYLSPIALIIILGYSYTKRFTSLCHLILGLGLSLAPIGSYLAVSEVFDMTPVLFSIVVLLWVSGFDIIYSLQDLDFDKKQQLYSIPVFLGKRKALLLSIILHIFCILILAFIGIDNEFTEYYWIGFSIFISLIFYQHTLVKEDDLSKINIAFFSTNGVASILFAIFVIIDLLIN